MFRKRALLMLAVGFASLSLPAFSQDEEGLRYRSEAAVQAFGSFVKSTVNDGVNQSATNSGGVLGSYRFFFTNHHGVELNYGYALNTQSYALTSGALGIKSSAHEASAAYVFHYALRHWSPFVLAGVGGLVFDPRDAPGANTQARAGFVYGGGADFSISRHVFMRAEYRGIVYNSPTYDLAGLNGLDRVTHRAEPSVGFGYRF